MVDALIAKRWISGFVFYYPFFMSYFWMIGGCCITSCSSAAHTR